MDYVTNWIGQHQHVIQLGGELGIAIGATLFIGARIIRWKSVSKSERSVAVGRDNLGTIITGDIGGPSSRAGGSWSTNIGLLLAFASLVVTILAWLTPVKQ